MNFDSTNAKPADIGQISRLSFPFLTYGFVSNLIILVSPLFMMQVLDRVVPTGNLSTLVLLLLFALSAVLLNGIVEFGRDRSLGRIARWIDYVCTSTIAKLGHSERAAALIDLQVVQRFFDKKHPVSLVALAWLPLFLLCLCFIHPLYLGLITIMSGLIFGLRAAAKIWGKSQVQSIQHQRLEEEKRMQQLNNANGSFRMDQASTKIAHQLLNARHERLALEDQLEGPTQISTAASAGLRMATQLLALSLGAYLVSQNIMSAGGMIAASVITAKALSSLEAAANAVKDLGEMKQAFGALQNIQFDDAQSNPIPSFKGDLICKGLTVPRGNGAPPRLDRINFQLAAGECLAIIGDAGSGKTTLLAALSGLKPAPIGMTLLDQTDVRHLPPEQRSKIIGFTSQEARVLLGTITENVTGFDQDIPMSDVVAACKQAKIHGTISALPNGYNTDIGEQGFLLTAGQRQQLMFANALLNRPQYLFLDEPNSLLDQKSERALCATIDELKANGTTVVIVLHRAGVIGLADKVLVLEQGRISDFGPRSQVLGRQIDQRRRLRLPLKLSSLQDLSDWIGSQFTRTGDAGFATKAVLLGTELFQAAYLNGKEEQSREMQLEFTFVDDINCEIQMIEQGENGAQKLLPKIQAALKNGHVDDSRMKPEERSLYLASKIASSLEITSRNDQSRFWARLTLDQAPSVEDRPN